MSKGLEAFTRLKALLLINTKEGKLTSILDLLNDIEKELKALEIIKEKLSPLARFTFLPMTQEEFELVEETLR